MKRQIQDYESIINTPCETWEIMSALRHVLGRSAFMQFLGVSAAQMDRYCRNPRCSEDFDRNPLERLGDVLTNAVIGGGEKHVRQAVDHLLRPLGLRVAPVESGEPDKPTVEEEILDDYSTLNLFASLMRSKEHPSVVRTAKDKLIAEIEETFVRYSQTINGR